MSDIGSGKMIYRPARPRRGEIEESRARREKRNEEFLRFGLDRASMTGFVVDTAEPLDGRILDVGTGKGFTAVELARRGASVTTVDISEDELNAAYLYAVDSGVADRIEFHLADAGDLPFEESSFGIITMIDVLHHLENAGEVLPEISRVLVPGGRLVVSDFTERGFDLLEELHRQEGVGHDRHAGETIDQFALRLGDHGMRCRARDRRFHQYVMVAEKD
jgi:ubiquinone/menaquinone biosynthesis C-methylase UbiE